MSWLILLVLGGLLILLGVALLPVPVPLVLLTIALGLMLVVANSMSAASAVRCLRAKRPLLDARIYRTGGRLPRAACAEYWQPLTHAKRRRRSDYERPPFPFLHNTGSAGGIAAAVRLVTSGRSRVGGARRGDASAADPGSASSWRRSASGCSSRVACGRRPCCGGYGYGSHA